MARAPKRSLQALRGATYDVFVAPFANHAKERFFFLQNMGNTHPNCMYSETGEYLEAYNVPGPLEPGGVKVCNEKDVRVIAATCGRALVPRVRRGGRSPLVRRAREVLDGLQAQGRLGGEHRRIVEKIDPGSREFVCYLLEHGLLAPEHVRNLVLVENLTDYDEILRTLAATDYRVVPYNPAPDFRSLCDRYGVALRTPTTREISKLNNKHEFRELVEKLRPGTYSYPRIWCPAGKRPTLKQLETAMNYYPRLPGQAQDVLFIQKTHGGGGSGNYKVSQEADGRFVIHGRQKSLANLKELAQFIAELHSGVEISPFLELLESPSFGLVCGRQAVACVGPFRQILNKKNDYIGFILDQNDGLGGFGRELTTFLRQKLPGIESLCLEIGALQRQHGYQGYSSIDALIYRDNHGQLQLSFSEQNVRYTGTCMLQLLVHARPAARERLIQGKLSIMCHELVAISDEVLHSTEGSITQLAQLLIEKGVPLMSGKNDEGVVMMSKLHIVGDRPYVGIGIVAGSDQQRRMIFDQVCALFGA